MSWTTPRTWVAGEIITAALGNTHWRDNLRYLKGLDGALTLSDALILPDGAGYYIHIPILTTIQRDALTSTNGMLIYNTTTAKFNKYENGVWRADFGYNSDIATLQIASQAQGDIIYYSGSAWARLGAGTSGQILKTQGAAANPIWASAIATLTSGNYTGDSTINRAIPHGLGNTPRIVFIHLSLQTNQLAHIFGAQGYIATVGSVAGGLAVTIPNSTNFYVGNNASYDVSMNLTATVYYWVAIG